MLGSGRACEVEEAARAAAARLAVQVCLSRQVRLAGRR